MNRKTDRLKLKYLFPLYDDFFSFLILAKKSNHRLEDAPPLFIVGSGRNGSTLLACILNNHDSIVIPPEDHIIPTAIMYWHKHPFKSWAAKVNRILHFLKAPSLWNYDFRNVRKELLAAPSSCRNINYLIHQLYASIGRLRGKKDFIWGDKTPANTHFVKLIKAQFRNSKFIFLIRDPRDVMLSYLKADFTYYLERFDLMLWRWQDGIKKFEWLRKKHPADVIIIKYEELVSDPAAEINKIVAWLNLPTKPNILENFNQNIEFLGVRQAQNHQNLYQEISTSSIGKWKMDLADDLARRIVQEVGKNMIRFGYNI